MKRDLHMLVERDEEGWLVGSVPSLPGCHTQARTWDELLERMREAVDVYLGECGEEVVINEFVGIQKITVDA